MAARQAKTSARNAGELPFLPYGQHVIEDDDVEAVARVMREDLLTGGRAVVEFEEALASATGAPHAVSCSSGTAALHIAYAAAGLGPGEAAIVPALTFLATANAAIYCGAEVVFADVDPLTGLMGPEHLKEALRRVPQGLRPRLVTPVHLNGQCCDMPAIAEIARDEGLSIIEDACHAVGGETEAGGRVGSCAQSDAAAFSFHPVKTIAMGEGGAVTTRSAQMAEAMRRMRNHGMAHRPDRPADPALGLAGDGTPNPWFYEMREPGNNYRASSLHCALGLSQLGKLDRFVARRAELMALYREKLKPLAPAVQPVPAGQDGRIAWHLNSVLIDFQQIGKERAEVIKALGARGIGSQVHYLPVCWQPYYRERYGDVAVPGAAAYYARQLSLPLFAAMTEADVERVAVALQEVTSN